MPAPVMLGTPLRTGYATVSTISTGTIAGYKPLMGDIIAVFVRVGAASPAFTVPANWFNPLGGTTLETAADCAEFVICHAITAAEQIAATVAWTFTSIFGSSQTGATYTCAVRGANAITPIDTFGVTELSTTTTTQQLAGITPNNTNSLVIAGIGGGATGTYTVPAGWTLEAPSAGGQNSGTLALMTGLTQAGVAIPATNITISTAAQYASVTLAFAANPNPNGNIAQAIARSSLF